MVRPSGLQYRILRNGFGVHPTAADTVQISYSAHLINAKLVDTATGDLPAVMVAAMSCASSERSAATDAKYISWELVIPSDLAFGGKGTPNGNIPPNQTLLFDITLLSVTPAQTAQGQVGVLAASVYGCDRGIGHEAGASSQYRNDDP